MIECFIIDDYDIDKSFNFFYFFMAHIIITPEVNMNTPIPVMIIPLTVQLGLLYINEASAPNADLLCAANINPITANVSPITINILPIDFLSI